MRAKINPRLKTCRIPHPSGVVGDEHNGAWNVLGPLRRRLVILASDGLMWDHVSVSVEGSDETPTWEEMTWVKNLFFDEEECVMQLHPPKSQYVNCHPGALHMWRPHDQPIPQPPRIMV